MLPIKKTHRNMQPLGQHNFSPDLASKGATSPYQPNLKNYTDTAAQSHIHPHAKQFSESPDYLSKKKKEEDYYWNMAISELNLELDNNMNEIIFLLGKRKNLVSAKKRKIIEQAQYKLDNAKQNSEHSQYDIVNDEEFTRVTEFSQNPLTAVKMLAKIIRTMPEMKGPRSDEEERSDQFWGKNRKLENDIDTILEKLKIIDKNLERQNDEVHEICTQLDRIEDTLKSFVGAKSSEHVQKVEPLFHSKKKNYQILTRKIKDRESSKDRKIEFVKKIRSILEQLKRTRQFRLNEIAQFFGLDSFEELETINIKEDGDLTSGFQELLKIKDKEAQLEKSEQQVLLEMELLQKDQEKIYHDILKKQSDQAKAFHNFSSIVNQRAKYLAILNLFENGNDKQNLWNLESRQLSKKFKEMKQFFKRFIDQDILLKQGLVKTEETSKTFINLLRAIENEKQRRHELLILLETCIKKRGQYEHKRQEFRNIQFQQSRNDQEMTQHEQDLEAILTDGDLEGYKKIGGSIGKCEHEKVRLNHLRQLLQKQMESMDRQVLSIANRIQQQYEDILSDILPSDYQYSLRNGEDVKKLRNHLRKMYKRLGILGQ